MKGFAREKQKNAQRSTLNAERSIQSSALDVGCWTLSVGRLPWFASAIIDTITLHHA
jgi:hypothetical protein